MYINSDVLPELNWASRLGASSLPSVSSLGTSMSAAGPFTIAAHPLSRVRGKVAVLVPQAQQDAVTDPGPSNPVAPVPLTVASRHCIGAIPPRLPVLVVVTRFLARRGPRPLND